MNISDVMDVKANPKVPAISPGDTVRVRQKVVEGEKTRIQTFQGVVIRMRKAGAGTNFTVRRVSYGVGVERTFPIYSPMIDGVEVVRHGKVRRAKLYYLRGLSARASRIKEKRIEKLGEEARPPEPSAEEQEASAALAPGVATGGGAEPAPAGASTQTAAEAAAPADAKAEKPKTAEETK